jgi:DNA-binding protein
MTEEKKQKEHKDAGEKKTDEKQEDNVIFIGNKPPMNYVTAIIAQFNSSGSNEVILKARGGAITRAVDAAEITRNRFMTDLVVKNITIGTESLTNEEGRTSNVSSIEICLAKSKK